MLEKMKKILCKIDYAMLLSALGLVIILPIGFSLSHEHYEGSCNSGPKLFLNHELKDTITPYVELVNNSKKIIRIIAHPLHQFTFMSELWIPPLIDAIQRGVDVQVISTQDTVRDLLNFTNFELIDGVNRTCFINLVIGDDDKLLYASSLLRDYSNDLGDFALLFDDCKSIVADAIGLFDYLKLFKNESHPTIFTHSYCPGFRYPSIHRTSSGNSLLFGIAPMDFVSPMRKHVIDLIRDFFDTENSNISIFSPSLFPPPAQSRVSMPEMVISDQIENSATFSNCSFRILLSVNELKSSSNVTMSLSRIPRIDMAACSASSMSPSFFVRDSETFFMPIPFQLAMINDVLSLALHIEDEDISVRLQEHFDRFWDDDKTIHFD